MRKRLMTCLFAGGLMAAMLPGVVSANFGNGPSSAGIVERFSAPGFGVWVDEAKGLLVLANVNSVADACNGIPAGAGDVQEVTLPSGVIVALLHDDHVPVLVVPLAGPEVICAAPGAWPVIATGTGNVRSQDNDVMESGSRMNAFGSSVTGSVVDGDDKVWSLRAAFRARIDQDGDFILTREVIDLVKRGN